MKKDELWDIFEKSGRVDNYLVYRMAMNANNNQTAANGGTDGTKQWPDGLSNQDNGIQ